jgi:hypothetical protein
VPCRATGNLNGVVKRLWRGDGHVGPVVAQECPQDVEAAAARERNDGLVVSAGVLALFQVVVPAGPVTHHAGLRGQIEHAAQRAAVTAGLVQVPGLAPGVVGDRDQAGRSGEMAGAGICRQVSCGHQEGRAQDGPNPGMDWMISPGDAQRTSRRSAPRVL